MLFWLAWDWPLWGHRAAYRDPGREKRVAAIFRYRFIFLFRVRESASPLSSAAALSPFGDKAGAPQPFWFLAMAGAACGASLELSWTRPGLRAGTVLALTSLLALVLHGWKRRPE